MANQKQFTGLSINKLNEVLQSPVVRQALRQKAQRALPRTKAVAFSAGASEFARALRVVEGTRPGTRAKSGLQRSYARVSAPVTDEMIRKDSRANLTRRVILRRGSNG